MDGTLPVYLVYHNNRFNRSRAFSERSGSEALGLREHDQKQHAINRSQDAFYLPTEIRVPRVSEC